MCPRRSMDDTSTISPTSSDQRARVRTSWSPRSGRKARSASRRSLAMATLIIASASRCVAVVVVLMPKPVSSASWRGVQALGALCPVTRDTASSIRAIRRTRSVSSGLLIPRRFARSMSAGSAEASRCVSTSAAPCQLSNATPNTPRRKRDTARSWAPRHPVSQSRRSGRPRLRRSAVLQGQGTVVSGIRLGVRMADRRTALPLEVSANSLGLWAAHENPVLGRQRNCRAMSEGSAPCWVDAFKRVPGLAIAAAEPSTGRSHGHLSRSRLAPAVGRARGRSAVPATVPQSVPGHAFPSSAPARGAILAFRPRSSSERHACRFMGGPRDTPPGSRR